MLERVEHRSSPQVQQKGPSCDGAIWWFEIAGEGFEPPTFGLLSQKFDWPLLSFQPTDCRLFRSIHHKIAVRQHNRLSSSSSGCGAKALVHAPISGCPRCSRVMWPGGRSGMLIDFLEKAVATGCDSIEIEYKDGKEWVTAFWDCIGYGIGHLDPDEAKPMFKEMDDLKRKKEVTISGVRYGLAWDLMTSN